MYDEVVAPIGDFLPRDPCSGSVSPLQQAMWCWFIVYKASQGAPPYLMKAQGLFWADALTLLQEKRPIVKPNVTFMQVLSRVVIEIPGFNFKKADHTERLLIR